MSTKLSKHAHVAMVLNSVIKRLKCSVAVAITTLPCFVFTMPVVLVLCIVLIYQLLLGEQTRQVERRLNAKPSLPVG